MQFFFNLIGVDTYILSYTRDEKRTGFVIAGIITVSLFILSFLSSYYLMTYLVKNVTMDVLIALLFSSILFNFYRFTISSIIWRSPKIEEPAKVEPPDLSTTVIKLLSCGFFIILVSKPIELWIFHTGVLKWMQGADTAKHALYANFDMLHAHYPATWLITILMLGIFLWPLLFRSYSKKWGNKEYESKHYEALIAHIRINFDLFEGQYNQIFGNKLKLHCSFAYEERYYDEAHKNDRRYIKTVFTAYRTQYANPPFDTLLKDNVVNTKGKAMAQGTSQEFFEFMDQLPYEKEGKGP